MSLSDAQKQRLQQLAQVAKEDLGDCYHSEGQPTTFGKLSQPERGRTTDVHSHAGLDGLALLGEEDFPDFLWQVLLGMCGLFSDLVLGNRRSNLGLLTPKFKERAWPVLKELGCAGLPIWRNDWPTDERIEEVCQQHDRPMAIWGRIPLARWGRVDARCIVASQNHFSALCRRLEGNWYIVRAEAPIDCPQGQIRALRRLLESWLLQWAAFDFVPRQRGPLGVLESLRTLLVDNRVNPVSLDRAAQGMKWPVPSGDPAALAEMLHMLMCDEKMGVLPGDGCSLDTELRRVTKDSQERLLIPVGAIERLLAERHAAWNRERVIDTLRKHRLLRGRRNGYWAVPADWWWGTADMESAPFFGVRI